MKIPNDPNNLRHSRRINRNLESFNDREITDLRVRVLTVLLPIIKTSEWVKLKAVSQCILELLKRLLF